MGVCRACGRESVTISSKIGFCVRCIREKWPEIGREIEKIHRLTRKDFGLPEVPPKAPDGLPCNLCHHKCRILEGEYGYCGVWQNRQGRLIGPGRDGAYVSWYLDPLPTNCVADFVCPGGTGAGYPHFAYLPGPERGYANLAVFYEACNFNCLYCQNWHFRNRRLGGPLISSANMFADLKEHVSCVCFFGGDPGPQALHAIFWADKARELRKEKIFRVCWETNGAENFRVIKEMMRLSLGSGGCIKIDLKAASVTVHQALCGVSNKQTWENFALLAEMAEGRPELPALVASTLLVPGYVDEEELEKIASFISSLSKDIPWSLLAYYPTFYLDDLPTTSRRHVEMALAIAKKYGLKKVNIGNRHLISEAY
ncbi:Radical SAM domain protein [Thermodesulfatator indicus DSM 15286]|uniref:Radical SAM domain protein n=1 Tax=Thermodesulfatator indicus (strain DSM 15286 / JCM 11887 / CIR29812) TaxID=667014 RepID=F8ABP4_THEID|nr:radical SAM protein [Thermodesulfatator indicus]AEH44496.1 Radical SAM domain protein [Thermodesulfatator indicus DSM 15286]